MAIRRAGNKSEKGSQIEKLSARAMLDIAICTRHPQVRLPIWFFGQAIGCGCAVVWAGRFRRVFLVGKSTSTTPFF